MEKVYSNLDIPFPVCLRVDDCSKMEIFYLDRYIEPVRNPIPCAEELRNGDIIEFGYYVNDTDGIPRPLEWKVANIKDEKALLITCNTIEVLMYKNDYYGISDEKWDESLLKYWLNGVFLKYVFQDKEKSRICNSNETGDKVFILNEKEIRGYDCLECGRTEWVKSKCNRAWMEENYCKYWLRDGKVVDLTGRWCAASYEDMVNENLYWDSTPETYGTHLNKEHIMVRPAMWIEI